MCPSRRRILAIVQFLTAEDDSASLPLDHDDLALSGFVEEAEPVLAAEVVKEESEKSPMAKKVHASFTKFQVQLAGWSRISEGAYQQFVAL